MTCLERCLAGAQRCCCRWWRQWWQCRGWQVFLETVTWKATWLLTLELFLSLSWPRSCPPSVPICGFKFYFLPPPYALPGIHTRQILVFSLPVWISHHPSWDLTTRPLSSIVTDGKEGCRQRAASFPLEMGWAVGDKRRGVGREQHLFPGDGMGCRWSANRHWWAWGDRKKNEQVLRSEVWGQSSLGPCPEHWCSWVPSWTIGYLWAKGCQGLLGFYGEIPRSFVELHRNILK